LGEKMSRAFMFEKDDMFHCEQKNKDCKHANLRGGCDLDRCVDDEVNNTKPGLDVAKKE